MADSSTLLLLPPSAPGTSRPPDIYRLLCERGDLDVNSDLDYMGSTHCWAVIKNNLPLVKFLLRKAQAEPNWPLIIKEVEIAALLLDCGAEYDPGFLYLAVKNGNWPVAELLVAMATASTHAN
ncbi:hypothetical protein DFJ73DRAFT_774031 [Zopfochytrium polystomum]|nr:hypothetical protein DFJ73DRAFT_774031 [Zopfochytrium polystomum]